MAKRRSYIEEAEKLGQAIDIAVEAFKNRIPKDWQKEHVDHTISCYQEWKSETLNPEPQFRNLASLQYQIEAVFTYFQEGTGETVEYFWRKIDKSGLGYKRENKLEKILKRGKIRGRIEYDYVIDMVVVAEQTGITTAKESKKLNQMTGEYELKKKR